MTRRGLTVEVRQLYIHEFVYNRQGHYCFISFFIHSTPTPAFLPYLTSQRKHCICTVLNHLLIRNRQRKDVAPKLKMTSVPVVLDQSVRGLWFLNEDSLQQFLECRQCSMQRRLLRSVCASARRVSAAWSE